MESLSFSGLPSFYACRGAARDGDLVTNGFLAGADPGDAQPRGLSACRSYRHPDGAAEALERFGDSCPATRLTRGGQFWHLSGGRHDKADAVPRLRQLFGRRGPAVGLGDAPNDPRFLAAVDVPIVVPRAAGSDVRLLSALPDARVAPEPGGAGWAAAVSALLDDEAA